MKRAKGKDLREKLENAAKAVKEVHEHVARARARLAPMALVEQGKLVHTVRRSDAEEVRVTFDKVTSTLALRRWTRNDDGEWSPDPCHGYSEDVTDFAESFLGNLEEAQQPPYGDWGPWHKAARVYWDQNYYEHDGRALVAIRGWTPLEQEDPDVYYEYDYETERWPDPCLGIVLWADELADVTDGVLAALEEHDRKEGE